jgi:hypothetical protein
MNKSMIAMAIVGILALAETVLPGGTDEDTLIQGFLNPPETAKPWAYWWWLDNFAAKEGIKATYKKTFDLLKDIRKSDNRLYLDLGRIKNVTEVRLNGKDLGVVWTAPWRVEITDAVRPMDNRLEIDVVNLWPNRLIGDAALPPKKRLTKTNVKKFHEDYPLYPSGLLGPVTFQRSRRHDCPGGSAAGSPSVRASAGATGRRIP